MPFQQSAENEARSFFNWDSSNDEGDRSDFVTPNSSGFIDGNAFLTPDALRETLPEDPFTDVFIDQSRITNPIRAPTFPTIVQMEQGMLNQVSQSQQTTAFFLASIVKDLRLQNHEPFNCIQRLVLQFSLVIRPILTIQFSLQHSHSFQALLNLQ